MSVFPGAQCDEFFCGCRLYFKLDLAANRETVLHFFERLMREFPTLSKLRRREDGALILEEADAAAVSRRWIRLEPASLRFGCQAPTSLDEYRRYAGLILRQAPFHLTLSPLDIDHLEAIFGFELEYRGNHDQIVAETLFGDHPLVNAFLEACESVGAAPTVIDCQPFFGAALTGGCDLQAYVEIKNRTSTFEVRSGEYEPRPLTVYLTVRKYWMERSIEALAPQYLRLVDVGEQLASRFVIPQVVNPLAQAIASRP